MTDVLRSAHGLLLAAGLLALAGELIAWMSSHPERAPGPARFVTRLLRRAGAPEQAPRTPARDVRPAPPEGPRVPVGVDGLDKAQVEARVARGEVNVARDRTSRSFWSIVRANVLTRFNALLSALFIVALWVGPWQDALFGISIIVNSMTGVVQELRAKRTLDRLVVLSTPTARVVRSGQLGELPAEQIVIDDVVELGKGDQVPVDGRVIAADGLEVDESLLTGEANPVFKANGQDVLSGSAVVAGRGRVQAIRVGAMAYGRVLAAEAKQFSLAHSELRAGVDVLVAWVSWQAAPMAALLLVRQLGLAEGGWRDAVRGTIAASEGVIPQGLVLLTNVALAVAVIRLGRRKVLVQELAAVEALARADVLCLDKTGTLTTGRLQLEAVTPVGAPARSPDELRDVVAVLTRAHEAADPVATAIAAACPPPPDGSWKVLETVFFSSERRWSAATIEGRGTWVMGAPAVVFGASNDALAEAERLASMGRHVLALGWSAEPVARELTGPLDVRPAALVVLIEEVRPDVKATLGYLAEQGMAIKVISGDDTRTASAIAKEAGVAGADESMDGDALPADAEALAAMAERKVVFGRVTPRRKRDLIAGFRRRGHVVAMIGDGVNDVLALKDADLGIAVRTAAGATRAIARVVLLDGFSALPELLSEGRRVIANVERSANLFVAKSLCLLLMALAVAVVGVPFPLLPRQNTLAGSLSVGIPGFFLALAPNAARARSGFLERVLRFSVAAGCMGSAATLAAYGIARWLHPGDLVLARTAAVLTVTAWGMSLVGALPGPMRRLRIVLLMMVMAGAVLVMLWIRPLRELLGLALPPLDVWISATGLTAAASAGLGRFFAQLRREAEAGRGNVMHFQDDPPRR